MIQPIRFRPLFIAAGFLAALGVNAALAQTATQPAAPAQAAGQIPVVIGVLDTEAVVLGSKAGVSLTQQANAQLNALQNASQKQEDALIAKLKALNPQAADYATQRQALATADDKVRSDFDKNKQALDARVEKARQSLLKAATKVIQDVAKARGLTLILSRNSAPLYPEQWNITDEVVKRLNTALPSIKL